MSATVGAQRDWRWLGVVHRGLAVQQRAGQLGLLVVSPWPQSVGLNRQVVGGG
jgi:hypothetical protein